MMGLWAEVICLNAVKMTSLLNDEKCVKMLTVYARFWWHKPMGILLERFETYKVSTVEPLSNEVLVTYEHYIVE